MGVRRIELIHVPMRPGEYGFFLFLFSICFCSSSWSIKEWVRWVEFVFVGQGYIFAEGSERLSYPGAKELLMGGGQVWHRDGISMAAK